ncbi:MAG TPA: hypothetical protein PKC67_06370 [Kiritimatiellia bacterium]|nr:hypothetical protein [Kiritimatiellia bacterium]HMP33959.1 hypothetical protein [Kiritimatiellia bacterium]
MRLCVLIQRFDEFRHHRHRLPDFLLRLHLLLSHDLHHLLIE